MNNIKQMQKTHKKGGEENMIRKERGITLIALIISVVVMVILATVTINSIYNMAIVQKAQNGVQQYARESVKENEMLDSIPGLIENTTGKLSRIINGAGITLNKTELTIDAPGGTKTSEQLTATLNNISGTITWSSSNNTVATVSNNGTVTAVAAGTATITATVTVDGDDYTAECVVTVQPGVTLISFTINGESYQAQEGSTWEEYFTSNLNPRNSCKKLWKCIFWSMRVS